MDALSVGPRANRSECCSRKASGYSYTGLFKPLTGVALAAVILGEPIRLTFVLGEALVFVGVWVSALSFLRNEEPSLCTSAIHQLGMLTLAA